MRKFIRRKRDILFLLSAAFILLCPGLFSACGKKQDSSVTLSLNESQIEMETYDEYTLIATVSAEIPVEWSSSDEDVVTVDEGVLTATGVGSAIVTASAGKASASCAVTVTAATAAPVLKLERNFLSLQIGDEYEMEAVTSYKNLPLSGIVYSFRTDDGDGQVATFEQTADDKIKIRAVGIGKAGYYVYTTAKGVPLAQRLDITVTEPKPTFDSSDFTLGENGWEARISLIDTATDRMRLTPSVTVYLPDGGIADESEISWISSDETIVRTEGGSFVAVSEGVAEVVGRYDGEEMTVRVTVYRPSVEIEDHIVIELASLSDETFSAVLSGEMQGEVKDASIGGVSVFRSFVGNTLVINSDCLPSDAENMGEQKLLIDTDKAVYYADVSIYTKILRNADDLNRMGALSKAACEEPNLWGGYFVLGCDINYNAVFTGFISYSVLWPDSGKIWQGSGWNDGDSNGFKGVFDGCGYSIIGLEMNTAASGVFGVLHRDGVVKNVSFVDAKHGGRGGYICTAGSGRIENVYIRCIEQKSGNASDTSAFFFSNTCSPEARVIHCFVDTVPVSGIAYYAGIGSANLGAGNLDGVYCVGTSEALKVLGGQSSNERYGAYETYADLLNAGIDFSDYENEFWTLLNGLPYPKNSAPLTGGENVVLSSVYVQSGSGIQITVPRTGAVTLSPEAVAAGVTIRNGEIVFPESVAEGSSFTIKAYSVFDETAVKEVTVFVISAKTERIGLVEKVLCDMGETFTLDIGEAAVKGEIQEVVVNGKQFADFGYADGVLTLDKQTVSKMWGELEIKATFAETENGSIRSMTYVEIPLLLVTQILYSESDLNGFLTVAKQIDPRGGDYAGGYFVLGGDIECVGEYVPTGWSTFGNAYQGGFYGIFDGNGYSIVSLTVNGNLCGLIPWLGSNETGTEFGVIRNLSIIDACVKGNGGVLTSRGGGHIENVFVSVSMTANNLQWGNASSVLSSDTVRTLRLNKVIVEYLSKDGYEEGGYPLWNYYPQNGILNDVYVIGATLLYSYYNNSPKGIPDGNSGAYMTAGELKSSADLSAFENGFWTLADGLPVPARLKNVSEIYVTADKTIAESGETVTLSGARYYTEYILGAEAVGAGITVRYNKIVIPVSAKGLIFTVTARSLIDGAVSQSITVTVAEVVSVDFGQTVNVDPDSSEFTVDMSGTDWSDGKLLRVTADGKSFADVDYASGRLTLDRATLGTVMGEKTVTAVILSGTKKFTIAVCVLMKYPGSLLIGKSYDVEYATLGSASTTFTLDISEYKDEISGTLSSASLSEVNGGGISLDGAIFGTASYADGILTLDKDTLNSDRDTVYTDSTTWGEYKLILSFTGGNYQRVEIPVLLVTKKIVTAADLDQLSWRSKDSCAEKYLWGGYFVLGADVAYNGTFTPFLYWSKTYPYENGVDITAIMPNGQHANWMDGDYHGFCGIFDGRGYSIDGLTIAMANTGIFGIMHRDGIVRNVAFTNAKLTAASGFLAHAGNGTFENIYIRIEQDTSNGANDIFYHNRCGKAAKIKNCFVKTTVVGENQALVVGNVYKDYGVIENVYCVGTTILGTVFTPGDVGTVADKGGAYATVAEFLAAGIDVSGWDKSFWTTGTDGLPLPVCLVE